MNRAAGSLVITNTTKYKAVKLQKLKTKSMPRIKTKFRMFKTKPNICVDISNVIFF